MSMTRGQIDVTRECDRQRTEEGWTEAHDDEAHDAGELARAGAAYALLAYARSANETTMAERLSPFPLNPKNPRRDLVRAAALIIAEIDRTDRVEGRKVAEGSL